MSKTKVPDTHIRINFAPDGRQRIHVEPIARLQERISGGLAPADLAVAFSWGKKHVLVVRLPDYFERSVLTGARLGIDVRDSVGAALLLLTRASLPRGQHLSMDSFADTEWWWVRTALNFKVAHHHLFMGGFLPPLARTARAIRERQTPPQQLVARMARFAFTALGRWRREYFDLDRGIPRCRAITRILSLAPMPGISAKAQRVCNEARDEKLECDEVVNTLMAHDPDDLGHLYVSKDGLIRWDAYRARDKLDKVLGRTRARKADRGEGGEPRREAKPKRLTYLSPQVPKEEEDMASLHDLALVEDHLNDLHELEAVSRAAEVGLNRLKERDHEMAMISMHLDLDGSEWGSRKHHRLLTEVGFDISADGLRKMVDRLRTTFGQS